MPKNQDQMLRQRWEKRQPSRYNTPSSPYLKERFGRVVVNLPSSPIWHYNNHILVKDRKSGVILLTIIWSYEGNWWEMWSGEKPDDSVPNPGTVTGTANGYSYTLISITSSPRAARMEDLPDDCLAVWTPDEFKEAFHPGKRSATLEACLELVLCPTCPSWTGGGNCFQCAKRLTKELYEDMTPTTPIGQ